MGSIRKNYSAALKAKVALEAVKKEKTISQLSSEYGVHANQINQWRRRLLEEKKSLNCSVEIKRQCIDPNHPQIPVTRQCELLGISRSSYYYRSTGDNSYNLALMRLIDEEYTRNPIYGVARMTAVLRRKRYIQSLI